MSMIEGIGDEVTVCFGIFSLLIVTVVAWISTNVQDPIIRIIILDRASLRRLLQRIQNLGGNTPRSTGNVDINTTNREADVRDSAANVQTHIVVTDTNLGSEDVTDLAPSSEDVVESTQSAPVSSVPPVATETSDSPQETARNTESDTRHKDSLDYRAGVLNKQTVPTTVSTEANSNSGDSESNTATITRTDTHIAAESTAEVTTDNTSEAPALVTVPEQPQPAQDNKKAPGEVNSGQETNITEAVNPQETHPVVEASTEPVEEIDIPEGSIRIKIKYLDERQKVVHAMPEDTIGQFKSHHFSSEISENFAVRFIYNGQELRQDANTLQSYNVQNDSVIHCLTSRVQQPQSQQQATVAPNLDIGFLMFPLFGLILALIWYCRFTYRNYFNAMSTFSLIGITFLFIVATLANFRNPGDIHEHHE